MTTNIQEIESLKTADTVDSVHDLIRKRWSPRAFSDEPVSTDQLRAVLEAARWAASSSNEQPWRFIVTTKADPAAFQKVLQTLAPGNQVWAEHAPVLIVMAAKRTTSSSGQPNYYALHDTGQALAHLMLEATALGLHAHAMAGFDQEKAREQLHIPEDFALGAAVALGHLGSPENLNEKQRASETSKRQRKPLSEIAFAGDWAKPLAL